MDDTEVAPGAEPNGAAPDVDEGWLRDKRGRQITGRRDGRPGVIYRQGNETLEEARARDSKGPKDRPPKSKPKTPKAPAPSQKSLKDLEFELSEMLSSPAMVCAVRGDQWGVKHFSSEGPTLARNLIAAAEVSPWFRSKLEAMLIGSDLMLAKIMILFPVASALIAYSIPPVIYYLDPKFIPPQAREMFKVPDRPKVAPPEESGHAPTPESPESETGPTETSFAAAA